ncbi:hypothetical protein ABQF34_01970 [Mycolicibacterium boenickei]
MYPADIVLFGARQLLGTMMSPDIVPSEFSLESPAHPNWEGAASDQARIASSRLDTKRRELREAHRTVAVTLAQSQQVRHDARTGVEAVDSAWQRDKAMLASYAQTAGGYAGLLKAGQRRISEVTDLINQTVRQYESLAGDIRAAANGLSKSDKTNEDVGTSRTESGQSPESGQSHEVQMVSSASDEPGAGSSGTGPGVPPVIVGRPRPVWPNGVPKV